jgi:hypothetical protein
VLMAERDILVAIIRLLSVPNESVQRQAAKAIANLGVNKDNKVTIAGAGAIPPLVTLVKTSPIAVQIEAIAALANLAVNGACVCRECSSCCDRACADRNEELIAEHGGIEPIVRAVMSVEGSDSVTTVGKKHVTLVQELRAQSARALRNLSVRVENKAKIRASGGERVLHSLAESHTERTSSQALKALKNLSNGAAASGDATPSTALPGPLTPSASSSATAAAAASSD